MDKYDNLRYNVFNKISENSLTSTGGGMKRQKQT